MVEWIFKQYKANKVRLRDLEVLIALSSDEDEKMALKRERADIVRAVRTVDRALETLTADEREVMFYRYIYRGSDWEWRATMNLYMSRTQFYRVLQKARQKFSDQMESFD